MTAHDAAVTHLRSGYMRWLAACPACPWTQLCMGQSEAEEGAAAHTLANDRSLDEPCACFVGERVEYEPSRCTQHRRTA